MVHIFANFPLPSILNINNFLHLKSLTIFCNDLKSFTFLFFNSGQLFSFFFGLKFETFLFFGLYLKTTSFFGLELETIFFSFFILVSNSTRFYCFNNRFF